MSPMGQMALTEGMDMLGGSFLVALLRNGMGAVLMMSVFLLLDRPRYSMNKTICCYTMFGLFMIAIFSIWYLADKDNFVRFSEPLSCIIIGIFCGLMSGEVVYLTPYKMTLSFYLLALCVFCGVGWWFDGNLWVDMMVRFMVCAVVLLFIGGKFRGIFLDNVDCLREEMDLFSAVILVVSVLMAALVAYWPPIHVFSVLNIVRIFIIMFMAMFMARTIQYMTFHLYIHLGKEHNYQVENQLLEMNEEFLYRQLNLSA